MRSRLAIAALCACFAAAPAAAGPSFASRAPAQPAEDCVSVDPLAIAPANVAGDWKVMQDRTVVLDYGADAQGAQRAVDVIRHYHFTRQCFVRRPNASMMYWKNGGAVPPGNMPAQDCTALNPASTQALFNGGRWKVMDGPLWLLDYNQDRGAAEDAARIIRTYRLDRECFIARPRVTMQYWLAQ